MAGAEAPHGLVCLAEAHGQERLAGANFRLTIFRHALCLSISTFHYLVQLTRTSFHHALRLSTSTFHSLVRPQELHCL